MMTEFAILVQCYERGGRYYADEIVTRRTAEGYCNSPLRGAPLGRSALGIDDAYADFVRRVGIENPDLTLTFVRATPEQIQKGGF